jgi:hypothetical protein
MGWARYVARRGNMRSAHIVLLGDLREREHLKEISVDMRIILKLIFKNWDVKYGLN